jgi:hypothetical protein
LSKHREKPASPLLVEFWEIETRGERVGEHLSLTLSTIDVMVRRDPETGQFVAGSEGHGFEYADLNFQHIHVGAVSPLGTVGDGADERFYEVLGGDLQPDQLAELVGFERSLGIDVIEHDTSQAQHGTMGAQCELGVNTDSEQRLSSDQRDPSWFTEDGPEYLDVSAQSTAWVAYNDSAVGISGAGGGFNIAEKQVWYRDHMDHGPFLDAADDLSIRVEADAQNCLHHIEAQVFYKLYWAVHRVENARPSFGSP